VVISGVQEEDLTQWQAHLTLLVLQVSAACLLDRLLALNE
jgi:hypothetical protein